MLRCMCLSLTEIGFVCFKVEIHRKVLAGSGKVLGSGEAAGHRIGPASHHDGYVLETVWLIRFMVPQTP